jgi:hypothetical protein
MQRSSTPEQVVAMLHMLSDLLAVRATHKAPATSGSSSSSSGVSSGLPAELAVPLYATAAEMALLMAGEPAVVAACCSLAVAVHGDVTSASALKTAAAAAAAALGDSRPSCVLARRLDQLLLHELLPAAVHAFKQAQQGSSSSSTSSSSERIDALCEALGTLLSSHVKATGKGEISRPDRMRQFTCPGTASRLSGSSYTRT